MKHSVAKMATREQPKRTYKLDEAVAFVLEPNSDSDMSDLEDSEDDEYIPDIVEREMDDDGGDDEVDENEENGLLMSDEASDDDGENNEDKCENATTSRLTFFCFACVSQGK